MEKELNKKIAELEKLIEEGEAIEGKFDIPLKIFGALILASLPLSFFSPIVLAAIPLDLLVIALMKNARNADMEKNKTMIEEKEKEIDEMLSDDEESEPTNVFSKDMEERLEAVDIYDVYGKELTRKYNISLECLLSVLDKFGLNDNQKDMVVSMIETDIRTSGTFSQEVHEHMLVLKRPEQK